MAIRKCAESGHFLERRRIEGGVFDETQWDHYAEKEKKITWQNGHAFHDIEARDSGHAMLQKVGVNNGDYGRAEILGKKLVNTLFGIQTKISYFYDDNQI